MHLMCRVLLSWSEFTRPIRCSVAEACVGEIGAHLNTQRCAPAYSGPGCTQCAINYFQSQGKCESCGSNDQTAIIVLTVIVGLAAMSVLALAVAFLTSLHLAYTIQAFVALQGAALVGVEGAKNIPLARDQITAAFTYVRIIALIECRGDTQVTAHDSLLSALYSRVPLAAQLNLLNFDVEVLVRFSLCHILSLLRTKARCSLPLRCASSLLSSLCSGPVAALCPHSTSQCKG